MLLLLSYFSHFLLCGPRVCFFSMFSCVCVFQMMQAACVHLCDPYSHPSTILLSFFSVYSEGFLLKFSIAAYLNLWRFFPLSNRSFLGGLKRGDTVKLPPVRSKGPHSSSHQNWEKFYGETHWRENELQYSSHKRLDLNNGDGERLILVLFRTTRPGRRRERRTGADGWVRSRFACKCVLMALFWNCLNNFAPLVPINLLFLDAMNPIVAFGPQKNQFTTSFLQHLVLPLE